MSDRVDVGIPGMNEILHGGLPIRNIVLLSGGPGTGKSIFGQQFLYAGFKLGEAGILVTLEEHPVQLRINMDRFGWEPKKFEQEGKFAIVDAFTSGIGESAKRERYVVKDPDDIPSFLDVLKQAIIDINAKRIVIDSISTLYMTKPMMARSTIMLIKKVLAGLGCTGFLISQVSVTDRGFGGPGVEHAADGIIRLDLDEYEGELKRSIIVWKMRGTSHSMRRHPFDITSKGIIVHPNKVIKLTARGIIEG
ncbi:MAG: KaiC domain-containing protein [Candidatus Methanomethyliaceae archaeon]|nr:KaiC domain-containing protein [Candidatus Methanomethyliaceae archaeon]MDW7971399.1 KaiC domain-containing protein [Nitrososphaerota archaeon]